MNKLIQRSFIVIIAVFMVIISCQKNTDNLPVLRIGHAPHDHHSPLYVAALNPKYFKEHGGIFLKEITPHKEYELILNDVVVARVLIDSGPGGKELIRKLSEDYFDMSFGGFPAMIYFIDQNNPIKILAPVMTEGSGLVVRKDLPVNNWTQFLEYIRKRNEPFRIGYKIDISVQNLIFEQALREMQIPYSNRIDDLQAKIVLLNLYGAKNLIPAMENGLIEAFVVMQPFLALAEEKNSGKVISSLNELPPAGKWQGHPCCALAANENYVQKYPEVSEAMLILMMRANRFINKFPQKSAVQIAHWLDMPPGVEKRSIPTIKFIIDFEESWNQGVDFWVNSMIKNGTLTGRVKDAYGAKRLKQVIYNDELYRRAKEKL